MNSSVTCYRLPVTPQSQGKNTLGEAAAGTGYFGNGITPDRREYFRHAIRPGRQGNLYAMLLLHRGLLKVGFSTRLWGRMREHERRHGPVSLIAVACGNIPAEQYVHRCLAQWRVEGETYTISALEPTIAIFLDVLGEVFNPPLKIQDLFDLTLRGRL